MYSIRQIESIFCGLIIKLAGRASLVISLYVFYTDAHNSHIDDIHTDTYSHTDTLRQQLVQLILLLFDTCCSCHFLSI